MKPMRTILIASFFMASLVLSTIVSSLCAAPRGLIGVCVSGATTGLSIFATRKISEKLKQLEQEKNPTPDQKKTKLILGYAKWVAHGVTALAGIATTFYLGRMAFGSNGTAAATRPGRATGPFPFARQLQPEEFRQQVEQQHEQLIREQREAQQAEQAAAEADAVRRENREFNAREEAREEERELERVRLQAQRELARRELARARERADRENRQRAPAVAQQAMAGRQQPPRPVNQQLRQIDIQEELHAQGGLDENALAARIRQQEEQFQLQPQQQVQQQVAAHEQNWDHIIDPNPAPAIAAVPEITNPVQVAQLREAIQQGNVNDVRRLVIDEHVSAFSDANLWTQARQNIRNIMPELAAQLANRSCPACLETIRANPEYYATGSNQCLHFMCMGCKVGWAQRAQNAQRPGDCPTCRRTDA